MTTAASKLMGEELTRQTKSSGTALLVVSIIQMVVSGVIFMVLMNSPRFRMGQVNMPILVASTFGVALIFLALYFWSRRSPLPAITVGLVVYGTLVVLNVVISLSSIANNGPRGTGIGGCGIGWLDIVILAILGRGISAALQQRKLSSMESQ